MVWDPDEAYFLRSSWMAQNDGEGGKPVGECGWIESSLMLRGLTMHPCLPPWRALSMKDCSAGDPQPSPWNAKGGV